MSFTSSKSKSETEPLFTTIPEESPKFSTINLSQKHTIYEDKIKIEDEQLRRSETFGNVLEAPDNINTSQRGTESNNPNTTRDSETSRAVSFGCNDEEFQFGNSTQK